jgi:hypothetical protein
MAIERLLVVNCNLLTFYEQERLQLTVTSSIAAVFVVLGSD